MVINDMSEIQKIKYQLALLAESLDSRDHPIPALVISLDWSQEDLSGAHDIFQEYDEKLDEEQVISWGEFENEFQEKLNLGYQKIKSVILAFYRNQQWTDVCAAYAHAYPCAEFHEINREAGKIYEQSIAGVIGSTGIVWQRNFLLPLGPGHFTEVDFFFSIEGKRIIVEAKNTVDAKDANNLMVKWNHVHGKNAADALVVVTENCTLDARELLSKDDIFVFSKSELRNFIGSKK